MNEDEYVLCKNCKYRNNIIDLYIGSYNECKYINKDNCVIIDPVNGPYYERLSCDDEGRNANLNCPYFEARKETLLFKLKKKFVKIVFGGDI